MRKAILIYLPVILILSFGNLIAQEDMKEEPAYISFLSGNVDVDITPQNDISDFEPAELDLELPVGSIIRTGREALCEITMPDESTISLTAGTVFQIEHSAINRDTGKTRQRFNFIAGRFKAKVKKFTTTDSEFSVVSGTSLAGVRGSILGGKARTGMGTDFLCFEGTLVIESLEDAFEPVVLNPGQMSFVPEEGMPTPAVEIPRETIEEWEEEFKPFEDEPEIVPEEVEEEVAEEIVEEIVEEIKEEPPAAPEPQKSILEDILALNAWIGTVSIENNVYAHWVFTPELTLGNFGLGLYLPAIFAPEVGILGFNEWYNHDEWDYLNLQDAIHDTLLKFYYIRWGEKGDPLFIKLGSIDDFTLGHGFIVDSYSNMVYFPQSRTMGLQFDLDTDGFGFETMIADFSRFQLIGGRIYVRPMGGSFPFAIGVTTVRDKPIPAYADERKQPNIFIFGADAELPVVRTDAFGLKFYVDIAKVGYLYQELPATLSGQATEGIIDFVDGLGTGIGLMGQIAQIFTYRAEYRFIIGYYEPGIINNLWENRRLYYSDELAGLLANRSYKDDITAGYLLRGGLTLFEKIELGLGFEAYDTTRYSLTESKNVRDSVKKADLYLGIKEGLIPKVYGSFSYKREDDLETVFQYPFDSNTMLEAIVVYEIATGVKLSFNAKRTFRYNDVSDMYEPIDSLSVRTIFTFF
ncbi:MAG: FecR domain-containing protein [Spirochaetota bacterium]|nr:MAG: FecR domain-containing protein [Spirochaetota bacterium]